MLGGSVRRHNVASSPTRTPGRVTLFTGRRTGIIQSADCALAEIVKTIAGGIGDRNDCGVLSFRSTEIA